jgi:MYXO-CTERM domain-containing protein
MLARRTHTLFAVVLFSAGTFGFAWPAYSIPVTFDFTVRVEYVLPVLGVELGVDSGGLLIGSLSFESTTSPQATNPPGVAEYLLDGNLRVSGGSFVLAATPYLLTVENDFSQADAIRLRDTDDSYDLSIDIVSADLAMLSSVALPLLPPDLSGLSFPSRRFIYSNSVGEGIFGHVETMTLAAPEPAANLLGALGLAGVVLVRRRTHGSHS